jgi:hypothetical protein
MTATLVGAGIGTFYRPLAIDRLKEFSANQNSRFCGIR